MNKISIIGAGRVGETTAQILAQRGMCQEVVLLDVRDGAAAGAALDIRQSASFHGFDTRVTGGSDPALMKDSGLVIVTAGSPRKPGMSRTWWILTVLLSTAWSTRCWNMRLTACC